VTTPDHLSLHVVMYHYVRDLPRTRWPRIHGLLLDDFRRQVAMLSDVYEMATLESALEFLENRYRPSRALCLLTFDDGLKEHYAEVTPILLEAGIQGVFMVHTSGPEGTVAAVHKNHFLLAAVEFDQYRRRFIDRLESLTGARCADPDDAQVRRLYRWDSLEVARFKYLSNFIVAEPVRQQILNELFQEYIGSERAFARHLYVEWDEARDMQSAGMVIGGHSHGHAALPALADEEKRADLTRSAELLRHNLYDQAAWPFSYPYGAVDDATVTILRELGFACAFTTRVETNEAGADPFRIGRMDPKDVVRQARGLHPCTS
jgi:peptidoglycan/xylan/chitin deacetylase (PgdA/CDA1 family)